MFDKKPAGEIQRAFGRHDVSGVQTHAAPASEALGALAYTAGSDIPLAGAPDLHTVAHEAAHVVQQKEGRVKPTLADTVAPFAGHAD
jgi:hypothetical protein